MHCTLLVLLSKSFGIQCSGYPAECPALMQITSSQAKSKTIRWRGFSQLFYFGKSPLLSGVPRSLDQVCIISHCAPRIAPLEPFVKYHWPSEKSVILALSICRQPSWKWQYKTARHSALVLEVLALAYQLAMRGVKADAQTTKAKQAILLFLKVLIVSVPLVLIVLQTIARPLCFWISSGNMSVSSFNK